MHWIFMENLMKIQRKKFAAPTNVQSKSIIFAAKETQKNIYENRGFTNFLHQFEAKFLGIRPAWFSYARNRPNVGVENKGCYVKHL